MILNKNLHLAATSNGNKIKLRAKSLHLRESVSKSAIKDYSNKITQKLIDNFKFENKNIHLFFPIPNKNEYDSWGLYNIIKETSKIHTSIYNKEAKTWECISFQKNTIFSNTAFNVPAPIDYKKSDWKEIDIILIPLLLFDEKGNRIGYGKGIYDRILTFLKPNCIKIGISILECSKIIIDKESHDISLDYCQTSNALFTF